MDFLHPRTI